MFFTIQTSRRKIIREIGSLRLFIYQSAGCGLEEPMVSHDLCGTIGIIDEMPLMILEEIAPGHKKDT